MPYQDSFQHADDVIKHLNTIVPSITDPLLVAKYVGFITISAVTVYEMAIKEIFIQFASKKNKVLGNLVAANFERINGRIKLKNISDDYLFKFGDRYAKRFRRQLDRCEKAYLKSNHRDVKSSYNNLIIWRNDFVHQGRISSQQTYNEVVQSYGDGKEVIHCLARCMTR